MSNGFDVDTDANWREQRRQVREQMRQQQEQETADGAGDGDDGDDEDEDSANQMDSRTEREQAQLERESEEQEEAVRVRTTGGNDSDDDDGGGIQARTIDTGPADDGGDESGETVRVTPTNSGTSDSGNGGESDANGASSETASADTGSGDATGGGEAGETGVEADTGGGGSREEQLQQAREERAGNIGAVDPEDVSAEVVEEDGQQMIRTRVENIEELSPGEQANIIGRQFSERTDAESISVRQESEDLFRVEIQTADGTETRLVPLSEAAAETASLQDARERVASDISGVDAKNVEAEVVEGEDGERQIQTRIENVEDLGPGAQANIIGRQFSEQRGAENVSVEQVDEDLFRVEFEEGGETQTALVPVSEAAAQEFQEEQVAGGIAGALTGGVESAVEFVDEQTQLGLDVGESLEDASLSDVAAGAEDVLASADETLDPLRSQKERTAQEFEDQLGVEVEAEDVAVDEAQGRAFITPSGEANIRERLAEQQIADELGVDAEEIQEEVGVSVTGQGSFETDISEELQERLAEESARQQLSEEAERDVSAEEFDLEAFERSEEEVAFLQERRQRLAEISAGVPFIEPDVPEPPAEEGYRIADVGTGLQRDLIDEAEVEKQLEEETGADLDREDFEVVEEGGEVVTRLTESGLERVQDSSDEQFGDFDLSVEVGGRTIDVEEEIDAAAAGVSRFGSLANESTQYIIRNPGKLALGETGEKIDQQIADTLRETPDPLVAASQAVPGDSQTSSYQVQEYLQDVARLQLRKQATESFTEPPEPDSSTDLGKEFLVAKGEQFIEGSDVIKERGGVNLDLVGGAVEGGINLVNAPRIVGTGIEATEFTAAGMLATTRSTLRDLGYDVEGEGIESFTSRSGTAAEAAVLEAAEGIAESPVKTTGAILGGLGASSAALKGAQTLGGPRTAKATSYAIQPGEELAISAAKSGLIPKSTATIVPGVREGHVHTDGGSGVGQAIQEEIRRVRRFAEEERGQADLTFGEQDTEITGEDIAGPRGRPRLAREDVGDIDVGLEQQRASQRGEFEVDDRSRDMAYERFRERFQDRFKTETDTGRSLIDLVRLEADLPEDPLQEQRELLEEAQRPQVETETAAFGEEATVAEDTAVDTRELLQEAQRPRLDDLLETEPRRELDSRVETRPIDRVEEDIGIETETDTRVDQRVDTDVDQSFEVAQETRVEPRTEPRLEQRTEPPTEPRRELPDLEEDSDPTRDRGFRDRRFEDVVFETGIATAEELEEEGVLVDETSGEMIENSIAEEFSDVEDDILDDL